MSLRTNRSRVPRAHWLLAFSVTLPAAAPRADMDVESHGELGVESRVFTRKGGQGDRKNVAGIARVTLDVSQKPLRMRTRFFVRYDGFDDQRSAPFPEEAWLQWQQKRLRLRVGYQLQNWSALDAFHPADAINSRYMDGDLQDPEKLGEPMASLRLKLGNGFLEGMYMPFFTRPILPSARSRFRFAPLGMAPDETHVFNRFGERTDRRLHTQWAARVQQSLRKADVSAHAMQHVNRSLPVFEPNPYTGGMNVVYEHVTQFGGTYQQVLGNFVIKLEAAHRRFTKRKEDPYGTDLPPPMPVDPTAMPVEPAPRRRRDHTLVAGGIEWGIPHDGGGESTFVLEAQNAFGLRGTGEMMLVFQRDGFFAYRYDHGDEAGQSLTASIVVDLKERKQLFGNVQYSRRIGDTWSTEAGYRLIRFPPADPENPIGAEHLHNASYGYVNLVRSF